MFRRAHSVIKSTEEKEKIVDAERYWKIVNAFFNVRCRWWVKLLFNLGLHASQNGDRTCHDPSERAAQFDDFWRGFLSRLNNGWIQTRSKMGGLSVVQENDLYPPSLAPEVSSLENVDEVGMILFVCSFLFWATWLVMSMQQNIGSLSPSRGWGSAVDSFDISCCFQQFWQEHVWPHERVIIWTRLLWMKKRWDRLLASRKGAKSSKRTCSPWWNRLKIGVNSGAEWAYSP
jgi:hypothetical protein